VKLLIDIGNSRVKWGIGNGHSIEGPFAFPVPGESPAAAFERAWGGLAPRAVRFCSVSLGRLPDELRDWSLRQWGLEPWGLRSSAAAGALVNGYRQPGSLGADRWANLQGARALLGPADAVVVDAGTAVTVDALRADGRHLGGAILPGYRAALDGLRAAAPALPAPGEPACLPADATAEAMAGGSLVGLAGGIERVALELGRSLDRPVWLITGGDTDRLLPWLDAAWRHDPVLTLRGLNEDGEGRPCNS